jgi:hypothetical protein
MVVFDNDILRGYWAANPTDIHRLEMIVTARKIYNCIAFPFNPPLRHMFGKAAL